MWWLIISGVILMLIIYLLFAPFFIEINTDTGLFRFRFHRLASATLIVDSFNVNLKIIGWEKQIDLIKIRSAKSPRTKKEKKKKMKSKLSFHKIISLIKSFQVKKLFITIDTGNAQLNGILFPVFYGLGYKSGRDISINFLDKNILILKIENNMARIAWAYFKS